MENLKLEEGMQDIIIKIIESETITCDEEEIISLSLEKEISSVKGSFDFFFIYSIYFFHYKSDWSKNSFAEQPNSSEIAESIEKTRNQSSRKLKTQTKDTRGKIPFQCIECEKTFAGKMNLQQHIKNTHLGLLWLNLF